MLECPDSGRLSCSGRLGRPESLNPNVNQLHINCGGVKNLDVLDTLTKYSIQALCGRI